MNPLIQRLMNEALQLTRSGKLQAATDAIQRALRGGGNGRAPTSAPVSRDSITPSARSATSTARAPLYEDAYDTVLDVETRVVETATPEAAPAPAATIFDTVAERAPAEVELDRQADDAPLEPEQWLDGSFTHRSRTLAYKLYVPPSVAGAANAPKALVLMLHGCTQGPADFAAGTQMNELARELGVVVLYPEQTQHANAQKCWNWFKPQHQGRDRGEPALLAALTRSVMAEQGVDPARVFVAGLSAGGAMADILGRCYPDLFAAVGVHSGLASGSAKDVMSALAAMRSGAAAEPRTGLSQPLIVFHGDADATVHPRNGDAVATAALGAQMDAHASAQVSEGTSPRGQRYTRTLYPAAAGRGTVEHWRLHGAGHAWSGGHSQGSYTDPAGADASSEMLRFFLAHPRAGGAP